MHLDSKDRALVAALIDDGRTSAAKLARMIGLSERATRYRLQRLIDRGVVRIGAVIDPAQVGYPLIADVFVEIAPGELRSVAERLAQDERVSYVAAAIVRGHLSIQLCARDAEDLAATVAELVETIPAVRNTQTVLVPWKLKDVHQWQIPAAALDEPLPSARQSSGGQVAPSSA